MKLLLKFNLIFITVFVLGIVPAGYLTGRFLESVAHDQVLQQARLMLQAALGTRSYTETQLKPLLIKDPEFKRHFLPQTVPAYSAVEVLAYLQKDFPGYSYREAVLNPTNPRDRTVDWEADLVAAFHNDPKRREIIGERETPTGLSLFLARPLRVADAACLECHSTPRVAPASMLQQYGPSNGFGWHLNDLIGAQIISVPDSVSAEIAARGTKTLVLYLTAVFAAMLVIMNLLLYFLVLKPVGKISSMAEAISQGDMAVSELPVRGKDEIAILARAFNRMQHSLKRAMSMLSGDDL